VVMFARDPASIEAAATEVRGFARDGAQILGLTSDVTRLSDLERVVNETVDNFRGADIVFNNAGRPKPGVFDDLTDDDWRSAVDLNLTKAIRLTRLCLPWIARQALEPISSVLVSPPTRWPANTIITCWRLRALASPRFAYW
jgi:3-oxoacyl-[acyl-carrier protein] reductase